MLKRPVLRARTHIRRYGKPSHLRVLARDAVGDRARSFDSDRHLDAAMAWLCRAQEVTGCGGVSCGYFFDDGWRGPYPETTGYIIPTFLTYATLRGDPAFEERAARMGHWESDIQLASGAVRGGFGVNDYPIVFNTGQVVLGWAALFKRSAETRFAESLSRACDWLAQVQDDTGAWTRHTYQNTAHAYHTRVAWSLLEGWSITGEARHRCAAERQLQWALSRVRPNGWIEDMGFSVDEAPHTHTIAYTLRGLLECALRLDGELADGARRIVERAALRLMRRFELAKRDPYAAPPFLAGRFDSRFRSAASYSCLTGNCQLALVWLGLYEINGDARLLNAALKIVDHVVTTQSLDAGNPGIRGGIAGSYPIWGDYIPHGYPNWAAKFYADVLMRTEKIMRALEADPG